MPNAAPRLCTQPGCGELVRRPAHRCAEHDYPDEHRSSPKYRTAYWHSVRENQLRRAPYCERCLIERATTVPATDVHHRDGDNTNDAPENLESLCHSCHSSHTAREMGFGGHRG